jgi:uncharacterized membrane protein
MYRHIGIEGKINGMLYTNECNQCCEDVFFIFPIVILDVCLSKFGIYIGRNNFHIEEQTHAN